MPVVSRVTLRHLKMPLVRPYRLSYRTFEEFEPYLVEIEDSDGRSGFADAHISPGSSSETREGGWRFACERIEEILGLPSGAAKDRLLARFPESKAATTALVSAIEVMERNVNLLVTQPVTLPLLVPVNALSPGDVGQEVEDLLAKGFTTLKVKVGKDVDADLSRIAAIQDASRGRATLRLDANRAYTRDQGVAFASRLSPDAIELFEQPCDADDWDANAAVAAASRVPLMLDEPICTLADIERAATIGNVGFCKLKLKRFGGLDRLREGLDAVRARGMQPVLGDGLGSEVQGWLEACVATHTVDNAGEFNGFLKPHDRLFENPLPFSNGSIHLPEGYWPRLDRAAVDRFTIEKRTFHT
ncbi:mandelate racemase/muconate lactonizing enzyme family protein [Microvirga pakistanensis]|uniref:mandelate racemase/muconate lactonizing enzyme family protein n=1 Tax=Microvirga pakistanensis TaxID=1682650 RepID=UPI00141B9F47|nr:mandelate racemase/muconate lactonizing enzyme family protein [Microvirga pakistanensis]